MFFYLSCLRPPLVVASPSSPITLTPQIANDLRTEPFEGVQDVYYSWLQEAPGKPPVFIATTKLTTYRQATAYKEIPVPLPKGLRENQNWTLILTASNKSPPECAIPLGADDLGATPFAALSMPIAFNLRAAKSGQKQEQIERIYNFPVTRLSQGEVSELSPVPQLVKVSLRIREQTSFDLDKVAPTKHTSLGRLHCSDTLENLGQWHRTQLMACPAPGQALAARLAHRLAWPAGC